MTPGNVPSGRSNIVASAAVAVQSASFRGDVDGLRAVAILMIVAYHIALPGCGGGFIGVDVFFAISGWLITRNLILETEARGRIDLARFWAKRVRRLVPALSLTIVATSIASSLVLPRAEVSKAQGEGAAAALYVSNIFFRRVSEGYFGADVSRSPFLHTWSLGVEEQFYVLWPLVCIALLSVVPPERSPRSYLARTFAAILALSLTWNLFLTGAGGQRAFYALSARIWEFAAAGLLAAMPISHRLVNRRDTAAAIGGAALLVVSTVAFSHETPYPGSAALLPVVGALLLISAGEQRTGMAQTPGVTALLMSRPMQWLGRASYSLYLWHWPFIVLTVDAAGTDGVPIRAAAVLASFPVAYLAYRFVESPIRFAPSLMRSSRRTFALGGAATVTVLMVAGGAAFAVEHRRATDIDKQIERAGDNLFPNCVKLTSSSGIQYCGGGDLRSRDIVMLVGDSHASIWFNAVAETASENGAAAALYGEPGCPFIRVKARMLPENTLTMEECHRRRARGEALIRDLRPVAVILTEWNGYVGLIEDEAGKVPTSAAQAEIWKVAYTTFLSTLRKEGIRTAVILDNPTLSAPPERCLARTQSFAACAEPREKTLERTRILQTTELDVLSGLSDVPTLAPIKSLCNATECNVAIDGNLAYADDHHLTHAATKQMQAQLRRLVRTVLSR